MKILIRSTSKISADEHIVAPKYDKTKHEIKILVVDVPSDYHGELGDTFSGFSIDNCSKLFNLESKYLIVYDIYYGAEWQDMNNFVHGDLKDWMTNLTEWEIGYDAMHMYKYHFRYDNKEGVVFAKKIIRKEDAYDESTYNEIYELLLPYLNAYYGATNRP